MCVLQGHHKVKSYHVICDLLFSSQRTVAHVASGEVGGSEDIMSIVMRSSQSSQLKLESYQT